MFLDIRIARVLILELSTMPPFSFSTELVPIPYIVPSPRFSRLDSSVTCSRRASDSQPVSHHVAHHVGFDKNPN